MRFTEDQQKVIDSRGESLLVTAAAGSGKTAVLVRRILERVCDEKHPVDIDRILCLTFTEAAAAEMKARLLKGLDEMAANVRTHGAAPTGKNAGLARLERQKVLVHRAFIMTIDAFCNYVVSNHFREAHLEPGMKIMDEGLMKIMRQQVIDDFFEELYLLPEEDERRIKFITAVETISDRGDDRQLKELIFSICDAAESYPYPDEWLTGALRQYEAAPSGKAPWVADLYEAVADVFREAVSVFSACADRCSMIGHEKGQKIFEDDLERLRGILDMSQKEYTDKGNPAAGLGVFYDYHKNVHKGSFAAWKTFSDDREASDDLKNIRNGVKSVIERTGERFFRFSVERSMKDIGELAPFVASVIELATEFSIRLLAEKKENGVMTFADCEHYALDILTEKSDSGYVPSATAHELADYFEEVMCDEYQDSNEIQEAILSSVCRESRGEYNRFMVGDVKQSIYRFRKADPALILGKMEEYGDAGPRRRIDLKANFRSRKTVLDSVNAVFERTMTKSFAEIEYDERERLVFGSADYDTADDPRTELHLLERDKDCGYTDRQMQAKLICSLVKENVGRTLVTEKTGEGDAAVIRRRPARYADIAVLLRNTSMVKELTEEFKRHGVPLYVTSSKGYYDSPEIVTLLAFLRIIENPRQDTYLYRVMTSVVGGFSDADMARIKVGTAPEMTCLFDRVREYAREGAPYSPAGEGADKLTAKVRNFLSMLREYRAMVPYEGVGNIISRILYETGFLYYVLSMPDGEQRGRNIELLCSKAEEFEKNSAGGLYRFIRYIDEAVGGQGIDAGPAQAVAEGADTVRVYTIHKSKGLEFPICILGDLSHGMNFTDARESFLLNTKYGVACKYFDPVRRIKKQTILQKYFAFCEESMTRAEELRILYVAMTRAKEKLIFAGTVKSAGGAFAPAMLRTANCLLDYVLYGFEGSNISPDRVQHTASELLEKEVSQKLDTINRRDQLAQIAAEDPAGKEAADRFAERFAKVYSHPELAGLYTKTSVSELKKAAFEAATNEAAEQARQAVPAYKEGSGSLFGTAHHRVMELLDIEAVCAQEDDAAMAAEISRQIEVMVSEKRMPADYQNYVNQKRIAAFCKSPCGKRMAEAAVRGVLVREQPFFLGVPASEMDESLPANETVLVQGIIDALWEEDDGIVILDYKTDRINDISELTKRYKMQLYYYKRAARAAMGKKVKECILYSFCLGDEIAL